MTAQVAKRPPLTPSYWPGWIGVGVVPMFPVYDGAARRFKTRPPGEPPFYD